MVVRNASRSLLVVIAAALVAGGCSGRLVHREALDTTGKIAVVSVVMPRIADTSREPDRKVLQTAVDHAAAQVRAGLAGVRNWKVLDPAAIGGGKALHTFGKISGKDLAALFPQADEQGRVRTALGGALTSWRERFIGATGLATVPREALAPDGEFLPLEPAVRTVMLQQAGQLCRDLDVDAVVFTQLRGSVTHPRENAFIVTDGRTDGLLALSATLVIVDRTGRIIVDMGQRRIDDRSPQRDMLPLYLGAGKDAVASGRIDVADPKKRVQNALTVLADEALADLMAGLKKETQP